jgi:hypothetical protein
MSSQQTTQAQVWETPCKACHHKPLGSIVCDLIGPYTLKGKDGTEIDFMCLNMIDPASSWFEIVEILVTTDAVIQWIQRGNSVPRYMITNK